MCFDSHFISVSFQHEKQMFAQTLDPFASIPANWSIRRIIREWQPLNPIHIKLG